MAWIVLVRDKVLDLAPQLDELILYLEREMAGAGKGLSKVLSTPA